MSVNSKVENKILTCYLEGRIDSTNAPAIEDELTIIRLSKSHNEMVLDLEKLEYISSAGLRVILRLRKDEKKISLVNVSNEVYEVLEMTGFSEMLPVSKGFRVLSVDGCEVVGRGSNGIVYRINDDTVVKVYFNPDALPDIKRERDLARKAFVLGIPTAISYDVVRVGDSFGSVFELLNATSIAYLMRDNIDDIDKYIKIYVDFMKDIHATEVKPEDMPDMRTVAIGWANYVKEYLPEEKGEKLVSLMESVPVQHTMLHGDYHVRNLMVQNNEVLIIDMDTLCYGHPIFELASMFNAYEGFLELDHDMAIKFLGIPYDLCQLIWHKTLPMYLGTDDPKRIKEVEDKAKLIGYTRLMRRTIKRIGFEDETGKKMIENYKQNIVKLLDSIDVLTF